MPAEKNNSDEKKQPTSGSSRPNQMLKNADLIFVSDVHLHDEKDKRAQLLISLIRDCRETNVRKFVLGGDVFEFIGQGVATSRKNSHFFSMNFNY